MRRALLTVSFFGLLLLTGCFLTDAQGRHLSLEWRGGEAGLAGPYDGEMLVAKVKGSVYETGESVSVFGTCLSADDQPLTGTTGVLSAWYPNGTVLFSNVSMTEIEPGYYLYTGSMNPVRGTYLTEFTCTYQQQVARAFGEWQNPFWVAKIGEINTTTNEINTKVDNITLELGDLRITMNDSFEITWSQLESINVTINDTFINLSSQIQAVGDVANASVDRNDSYLASLLHQLLDQTNTTIGDFTENTTVTSPRHWHTWAAVTVLNGTGGSGSAGFLNGDQASCEITTNNRPPSLNEPMQYYASVEAFYNTVDTYNGVRKDVRFDDQLSQVLASVDSGFWYHEDFLKLKPFSSFEYDVQCELD